MAREVESSSEVIERAIEAGIEWYTTIGTYHSFPIQAVAGIVKAAAPILREDADQLAGALRELQYSARTGVYRLETLKRVEVALAAYEQRNK